MGTAVGNKDEARKKGAESKLKKKTQATMGEGDAFLMRQEGDQVRHLCLYRRGGYCLQREVFIWVDRGNVIE